MTSIETPGGAATGSDDAGGKSRAALQHFYFTMPAEPARYSELLGQGDPKHGIEAVWASVSDRAGSHRVLPDGRCDIILRFDAAALPIKAVTPVITGPTSTYYDVPISVGMGFAGIRLRPGFLHSVLKIKPSVLRDKNLLGEAALMASPALSELCRPANSLDELLDRLAKFVRRRAAESAAYPPLETRQILSAFHASSGQLRVQDIAKMHGISARSVQRIVLDATGLPPKTYAQILQFHRALRLLKDHRLTPAEAALEAGYADQPHMTCMLRTMGGLSSAHLADITLVTISD